MAIKQSEHGQLIEQLTILASALGRKCDQPYLAAYTIGLRDLDLAAVKRGVSRAIINGGKFFPKPSELRELCGVESFDMRVTMAIQQFDEAVRRFCPQASVDFEDKAINAAIRSMGGWEPLADIPTQEWKFALIRFEKHFRAIAMNGHSWTGHIVGSHERRNQGIENWKEQSRFRIHQIGRKPLGIGSTREQVRIA